MLKVADIIERLDGSASVSRETGIPLTTIEGWKEVNFVPAWRQSTLLDLANRTNKALSTRDFPPASERTPRQKREAA